MTSSPASKLLFLARMIAASDGDKKEPETVALIEALEELDQRLTDIEEALPEQPPPGAIRVYSYTKDVWSTKAAQVEPQRYRAWVSGVEEWNDKET